MLRDLRDACRQHTDVAIAALLKGLNNVTTLVPAAALLLAYGYGRPTQNINHRVIRSFADLTDEELAAIVAQGEADDSHEHAVH